MDRNAIKSASSVADTPVDGTEAERDNGQPAHRGRHLRGISLRHLFAVDVKTHDIISPGDIKVAAILESALEEEVLANSTPDNANSGSAPASPAYDGALSPIPSISVQKVRENGKAAYNGSPRSPPLVRRPQPSRKVSRSMTLAFAEATQRLYENRSLVRRVESFFTLHSVNHDHSICETPVYASEIHESAMNNEFQSLEGQNLADISFSRSHEFVIRVFTKIEAGTSFSLTTEEHIDLRRAVFVTKDVEYAYGAFRDNTILMHLPDGIYTTYSSSAFDRPPNPFKASSTELTSSSFDSLMKLKNLVAVIDDAVDTQMRLARQIESILASNDHVTISKAHDQEQKVLAVQNDRSRTDRELVRLKAEREKLKKEHATRRVAFENARKRLQVEKSRPSDIRASIEQRHKRGQDVKPSLQAHTARIAEDILSIFPLEPVPDEALAFTIRGLYLPHAKTFEGTGALPKDDLAVAAALGFVGTIVDSLSRHLLLHIPYTIHVLGSTSAIRDDITSARELENGNLVTTLSASGQAVGGGELPRGARVFPLYARGADLTRFRYGVYLLNRDLEELVSKCGLRVVDAKDTLVNVNFLLNALAAGTKEGQLPQRKAGRVAGLDGPRA